MKKPKYQRLDTNLIRAELPTFHEHFQVEMRWHQAVQQQRANRGQIPAPTILDGFQVELNARQIWTPGPILTLDWKWLRPSNVVCHVFPYTYKLELPASIQTHRVQPVLLLDLVVDEPLDGELVDLPPPVEVDSDKEYQDSSGEDSLVYYNQLQYLICCTRYDSLTSEPAKFVDALPALGTSTNCTLQSRDW